MAGGSGTRFWPASRSGYPKQFLPILGKRTLVEETLSRISPLFSDENIHIVINRVHHKHAVRLFGERKISIIEEPFGRNTLPCIGLSGLHIRRAEGNDNVVLVILPADHYIGEVEIFLKTIETGISLAEEGGFITIGIPPARPETGYGYLKKTGDGFSRFGVRAYEVERFVEKPDERLALEYLQSGDYLWNAGIFLMRLDVLFAEIERYQPELFRDLCLIEKAMGKKSHSSVVEEVYQGIKGVSIDYGIMELTGEKILAMEGMFPWSDVGSWQGLYELLRQRHDREGNISGENQFLIDTHNSFIYSLTGRFIAVMGLSNVLVVDTEDGILVGDLTQSQRVREITEFLKKNGREDLL